MLGNVHRLPDSEGVVLLRVEDSLLVLLADGDKQVMTDFFKPENLPADGLTLYSADGESVHVHGASQGPELGPGVWVLYTKGEVAGIMRSVHDVLGDALQPGTQQIAEQEEPLPDLPDLPPLPPVSDGAVAAAGAAPVPVPDGLPGGMTLADMAEMSDQGSGDSDSSGASAWRSYAGVAGLAGLFLLAGAGEASSDSGNMAVTGSPSSDVAALADAEMPVSVAPMDDSGEEEVDAEAEAEPDMDTESAEASGEAHADIDEQEEKEEVAEAEPEETGPEEVAPEDDTEVAEATGDTQEAETPEAAQEVADAESAETEAEQEGGEREELADQDADTTDILVGSDGELIALGEPPLPIESPPPVPAQALGDVVEAPPGVAEALANSSPGESLTLNLEALAEAAQGEQPEAEAESLLPMSMQDVLTIPQDSALGELGEAPTEALAEWAEGEVGSVLGDYPREVMDLGLENAISVSG